MNLLTCPLLALCAFVNIQNKPESKKPHRGVLLALNQPVRCRSIKHSLQGAGRACRTAHSKARGSSVQQQLQPLLVSLLFVAGLGIVRRLLQLLLSAFTNDSDTQMHLVSRFQVLRVGAEARRASASLVDTWDCKLLSFRDSWRTWSPVYEGRVFTQIRLKNMQE